MLEAVTEDFAQWRTQARKLLAAGIPPSRVHFLSAHGGQGMLLGANDTAALACAPSKVPRDFLSLAETVSCYRDPERWNLLYALLWRITHGEAYLLGDHADPLVRKIRIMAKAIRRDSHKMHAFVRFREAPDGTMVAWHRPDHLIVRANADFFVRRFGAMSWSILTPDECVYWNQSELRFGPGLPRESAPRDDEVEGLWLTYYGSIFNPARANLAAMTAEMPVKHWSTLPESKLISSLLTSAGARMERMIREQPASARTFLPVGKQGLAELERAARTCEACELCRTATQTVFGQGPADADMMLVGEQPGDTEDTAGVLFVGPAGEILDRALAAAGIERAGLYITNAVKHFRFEERGKQRIHKKPAGKHISACKPWLEGEIAAVKPRVIVCLGATAAQSLVGRDVRIGEDRGQLIPSLLAPYLTVTIHPSALLRLPPHASFDNEFARFADDLRRAGEYRSRASQDRLSDAAKAISESVSRRP